jgi:hypothetical protein
MPGGAAIIALECTLRRAAEYLNTWSQIRQENPLNLSISVSGGKETNKDSPSNGE